MYSEQLRNSLKEITLHNNADASAECHFCATKSKTHWQHPSLPAYAKGGYIGISFQEICSLWKQL